MLEPATVQTTYYRDPRRVYAALVPVPIACFAGAFITDLAYWQTALMTWATFSIWLIAAGLVMAGFTALAGFVEFLSSRHNRATRRSGRICLPTCRRAYCRW